MSISQEEMMRRAQERMDARRSGIDQRLAAFNQLEEVASRLGVGLTQALPGTGAMGGGYNLRSMFDVYSTRASQGVPVGTFAEWVNKQITSLGAPPLDFGDTSSIDRLPNSGGTGYTFGGGRETGGGGLPDPGNTGGTGGLPIGGGAGGTGGTGGLPGGGDGGYGRGDTPRRPVVDVNIPDPTRLRDPTGAGRFPTPTRPDTSNPGTGPDRGSLPGGLFASFGFAQGPAGGLLPVMLSQGANPYQQQQGRPNIVAPQMEPYLLPQQMFDPNIQGYQWFQPGELPGAPVYNPPPPNTGGPVGTGGGGGPGGRGRYAQQSVTGLLGMPQTPAALKGLLT